MENVFQAAVRGAYEQPTEPCPYCGTICECDMVDVGVGLTQCGPFHCDQCGASEIGAYDTNKSTACERLFGWYGPGKPPSDKANVIRGKLVSHQEMRAEYRAAFVGNPLWADKGYVDRWWEDVRQPQGDA